jgi:hypothetical protein
VQLHVGYRSLRLCEAQLLASLALPGERVWYGFFHGRVLEIVMFAINRTSARRTQGELSRFTSMAHINGTHVLSLLTFITSKLGMVAAEECRRLPTIRVVSYGTGITEHATMPRQRSRA